MIPFCIFALILSSTVLQWFPSLPYLTELTIGILVCLCFIQGYRWMCILLAVMLGFWVTTWYGQERLEKALPVSLINQTITVQGQIISVPTVRDQTTQFTAQLSEYKTAQGWQPFDLRAKLSIYPDRNMTTLLNMQIGDRWEWTVRLKPPHGMANPGGFSQEKSLFLQNIQATGYLVLKVPQKKISEQASMWQQFLAWRAELAQQMTLAVNNSDYVGLLQALTLGMYDDIKPEQWKILQVTGTAHLMGISGMHICLVSGLVFKLTSYLWRLRRRAYYRYSAPVVSAWMAIIAAFIYCAISGFVVPAQRACVMLMVVLWGLIQQRHYSSWHILSVAALFVWCLDPLATWTPGFWLSFGAVALLYFGLRDRIRPHYVWQQWGRTQWLMFVGLMPILLGFFSQLSLVSPFINIMVIPLVEGIIVPIALIGTILLPIFFNLGAMILKSADLGLQWVMVFLEWSAALPFAVWTFPFIPLTYVLLSCLGVFALLLPRGTPGRYCAAMTILPLFFITSPRPHIGEIWIHVLDVGQGLAIVVQTAEHTLIFDTGPKWFKSSDAGKSVVLPFLSQAGIKQIDTVVVSHPQADHDGGWETLQKNISIAKTYTGFLDDNTQYCLVNERWEWDDVSFEFLHPTDTLTGDLNNHSCVLRIKTGTQAILLTGDIEAEAEAQLLKNKQHLPASVLVAPHHGSLSSSTSAFIEAVQPQHVIYPVGYYNRFGFPKLAVMDRYDAIGARAWRTDLQGAVRVVLSPEHEPFISSFREEYLYFWR